MADRRVVLAIAGVLLAGCAGVATRNVPSEAAELADLTKGRVAKSPVDCISTSPSGMGSARVINGTLVYRDGSRLWVSDGETCIGGTGDPIVVLETWGTQLCRNDRYRAVLRGGSIPGPYCRVGRWTPYVKAG